LDYKDARAAFVIRSSLKLRAAGAVASPGSFVRAKNTLTQDDRAFFVGAQLSELIPHPSSF
jgi:hypothetical protein